MLKKAVTDDGSMKNTCIDIMFDSYAVVYACTTWLIYKIKL